uniref:Uncharacterized protein n=1 Tax=Kuenenia stuttgartiensis TaxID=174633 RepID=Q1PWR9_KUEST|nr:unknown protein [Candidatus Kuenenia stuttgartiensis]
MREYIPVLICHKIIFGIFTPFVPTQEHMGKSCQSQICVLYLIWYQIKFHQFRSSEFIKGICE